MKSTKELWDNILFTFNGTKYLTKFLREDIHGNIITVTMEAKPIAEIENE